MREKIRRFIEEAIQNPNEFRALRTFWGLALMRERGGQYDILHYPVPKFLPSGFETRNKPEEGEEIPVSKFLAVLGVRIEK